MDESRPDQRDPAYNYDEPGRPNGPDDRSSWHSALLLFVLALAVGYIGLSMWRHDGQPRHANLESTSAPSLMVSRAPKPSVVKSDPDSVFNEDKTGATGGASDTSATNNEATRCEAVTRPPSTDARWKQGLSLNVPREVLGGDVTEYRIRWGNGKWSKSYFPGDDDIDWKTNGGQSRRVWSYFYDHHHSFTLCRPVASSG